VAPLERLKILMQVQGNEKMYTGVVQVGARLGGRCRAALLCAGVNGAGGCRLGRPVPRCAACVLRLVVQLGAGLCGGWWGWGVHTRSAMQPTGSRSVGGVLRCLVAWVGGAAGLWRPLLAAPSAVAWYAPAVVHS
jgi:hypothetical protein